MATTVGGTISTIPVGKHQILSDEILLRFIFSIMLLLDLRIRIEFLWQTKHVEWHGIYRVVLVARKQEYSVPTSRIHASGC